MVNVMYRYKDSVEELIKKTRNLVETSGYKASEVGNRMHYPILVSMNVDGDAKEIRTQADIIRNKFRKFWPSTYRTALFIGQSCDDHIYNISSEDNNDSPVSVECFQQEQVSPVLKNNRRDDFAELSKWCFHNIISTVNMNSFEQFMTHYNFVDEVTDNILQTPTFSVAFIVIDESFGRNDKLNNEIKSFIQEQRQKGLSKYKGTFLISNRSSSGIQFDYKKDILPLISTLIISSDNDAVTETDDSSFRTVFSKVFGGQIYYVSHSLITKPNKYIALQMIDEVIGAVERLSTESDIQIDWKQVLGIKGETIEFFDEELKRIGFPIDLEEVACLPLIQIPPKEFDFGKVSYEEFIRYVDEDTFREYIQSYCDRQKENQAVINLLKQYESDIYKKIGVSVADSLNKPDEIDVLIGNIRFKAPSKKQSFASYFSEYVRYFLKENVVRPMIVKMLEGIRDSSGDTRGKFASFKQEFIEMKPVEGFDKLGSLYSNMVRNYLTTTDGSNNISLVLRPGNEAENFADSIYECIKDVIESAENKKIFKKSLHDEWQLRLSRLGDAVYNEINTSFSDDFERRVFYNNNLAAQPELEVYLLHINDRNTPDEKTGLYNYLSNATQQKDNVVFINTGYDDTVEAVQFYKVSEVGG